MKLVFFMRNDELSTSQFSTIHLPKGEPEIRILRPISATLFSKASRFELSARGCTLELMRVTTATTTSDRFSSSRRARSAEEQVSSDLDTQVQVLLIVEHFTDILSKTSLVRYSEERAR